MNFFYLDRYFLSTFSLKEFQIEKTTNTYTYSNFINKITMKKSKKIYTIIYRQIRSTFCIRNSNNGNDEGISMDCDDKLLNVSEF